LQIRAIFVLSRMLDTCNKRSILLWFTFLPEKWVEEMNKLNLWWWYDRRICIKWSKQSSTILFWMKHWVWEQDWNLMPTLLFFIRASYFVIDFWK
jgi:hypothetical protein